MGTLYKSSLEDISIDSTISITFVAGGLTMYTTFNWCTENQEQWDAFETYIKRLSKADPLYKKGEPYDRDYDYIDWYLQFENATAANNYQGYKDILEKSDGVPNSIRHYSFDNNALYTRLIIPRVQSCQEWVKYRNQFKECGVWLCTIYYGNDTRIARVIPGGWSCNQDDIFRFRFISDRDTIGYDDLPYVSFEVYTNG